MSSAYDYTVIDGVAWPAQSSAWSDMSIVDRGRRERRREARAGVRGRRGARRVPPCPMHLFEVRQKLDPETVRQVREVIEGWVSSPPKCIVLPGEFELEVLEPKHGAAPGVKI